MAIGLVGRVPHCCDAKEHPICFLRGACAKRDVEVSEKKKKKETRALSSTVYIREKYCVFAPPRKV